MYGAMREHAPHSTRLAGAFTALTVTAAFGYAMANGFGDYIAKALPDPLIYISLPEESLTEPPPIASQLDTSSDTLTIPDPIKDLLPFETEDPPIRAAANDELRLGPPIFPSTPAPPSAPVRVGAKLIPGALPPYPPIERRAEHEGMSTLSVCLDARGQVVSAQLTASSGWEALDSAALKWVRKQKFTPAKRDGQPQAICGHPVIYEWRIDRH